VREPGWLPFTTDDVREQCALFGAGVSGPHPLPVKDLLRLCDAIDELREAVAR